MKPGPRAWLRTLQERIVLLDAGQFPNWVRLR